MYNVGLSLLTLSIKMAGDRRDENGGKRENAKRDKQKKTGEYKFNASKYQRWGAGVVICLERGADLHMAQLMPLPLTVSCFSKSRLILPFWYRLTWVVPDKRCVCVRACTCASKYQYLLQEQSDQQAAAG